MELNSVRISSEAQDGQKREGSTQQENSNGRLTNNIKARIDDLNLQENEFEISVMKNGATGGAHYDYLAGRSMVESIT